ncbi:hypothetical protein PTKIN_Ptkin10aG0163200 [Pterospermum kingtungense]
MATTTKDKEMGNNVMQIEDIHRIERYSFWLERIAILTQVFCLQLPGPKLVVFPCPHYVLFFTALLLIVTNAIFIGLTFERQFIRPFFFEPEAIFYIERPAILLVILHYVVPGGYIYCAIIGLIVLILTNYLMINSCFINNTRDTENSLLSGTNTILHAKENSKDGNEEDEGLKEKSDVETKTRRNFVRFMRWFKDTMLFVLRSIFLDIILRERLLRGVRNHGEELKSSAEDESPDHQLPDAGNNECVWEESKTGNCVQEELRAVSLADDFEKIEDDLEEEDKVSCSEEVEIEEDDKVVEVTAMADQVVEETNIDETEGGSDLEGDNQSWENVQIDHSENLSDETESSIDDETKTDDDEVDDEETDDEATNDDDGSSWEEVQNMEKLGADEITSSDQRKEDELLELEEDEDEDEDEDHTSNYNSSEDENMEKLDAEITSSYRRKEGELELLTEDEDEDDTSNYNSSDEDEDDTSNYNSSDEDEDDTSNYNSSEEDESNSTSSEFLQQQMQESEAWEQEKKELTEKLEVATKFWKQYEQNCCFLVESWDAIERLVSKAYAEWDKEKEELQTKLDSVHKLLAKKRREWEDEKKDLREKLDVALEAVRIHKANEEGFAQERQKWDEEKMALNATVSNADENVQYCQTLVNTYSSWYQSCLNWFIAERNDLSSQLVATTSSAESYRAWCQDYVKFTAEQNELSSELVSATSSAESYKAKLFQSEEHCEYYKVCFEEYEAKYRKLKEENLELLSKLNTETSFAERYKRFVEELEEKCRRLEEEKTDLTAKACAAKALSEVYRACLHDVGA